MASLEMTEDRQMLLRTARDFVRERAPVSALRHVRDTHQPDGFDRALWRELCDLGLPSVAWSEREGGAGLGAVELGLVIEELGRTLAATPLFASVVLAGEVIRRAGSAQQRAWLPGIAAGKDLLALAYNEGPHHAPWQAKTRAERADAGYVLHGKKTFVLDGQVADRILVLARTAGEVGSRHGLTLFAVSRGAAGLSIAGLGMVDSRNAAHVSLEGVRVNEEAVIGATDMAADVLEPIFDRASVLLSAEMLGSASAAFEMTLEYLKTRRQFGVVIGSFQGLKHRAADMYAELSMARSVVADALLALDAERSDRAIVASAAKARLSDLFIRVASEGIQMHGGIGVTDEHDIGLYYKRARVTELLLGDANYHRDRFARLSGY